MKLGLHTYSLNMHGIGQAWAGFRWTIRRWGPALTRSTPCMSPKTP